MCSSQKFLHEFGMLDLAIKNSSHPPAEWVHSKVSMLGLIAVHQI